METHAITQKDKRRLEGPQADTALVHEIESQGAIGSRKNQ